MMNAQPAAPAPSPAATGAAVRVQRQCAACAEEDGRELQRAAIAHDTGASRHEFGQIAVLPPAAAPSEVLPVSEPSDPGEQEAERVAERVMATLSSGTPPEDRPRFAPRTGAVVQRAVDGEAPAPAQAAAPEGGFVVEDDAVTTMPGQLRKSDFLRQLRPAVCAAADRELARAGRSTDGCPYLDRWFAYYAGRDARQVERSLRRYAPETAHARSASDYIAPISGRVAQGVRRWIDTGQMPELPEGVSASMLGGGGVLGGLAQVGAAVGGAISSGLSAIGGAISSGLSAVGGFFRGLFFKAEPGGAAVGADRGALHAQLGAGRPLDSASRSRMGSAFGYDFGAVRIHDDAAAAALSRGLNARAFTLGSHVAFGANEYRPGQPIGDALLAHELAHVVQQGGASSGMVKEAPAAHDAMEEEADAAAVAATLALWAPEQASDQKRERRAVNKRSGLRLQRCASAPRAAAAQQLTRLPYGASTGSTFGPRRPSPENWAQRVQAATAPGDRASVIQAAVGLRVEDVTAASAGDASPQAAHLHEYSTASPVINYDDGLNRKVSSSDGRRLDQNAGFTLQSGDRTLVILGPRSLSENDYDQTLLTVNHEFDHVRQIRSGSTLRGNESELDAWTSSFIRDFQRQYILDETSSTCFVRSIPQYQPLIRYYASSTVSDAQRDASVQRIARHYRNTLSGHDGHRHVFRYWIYRTLRMTDSPNIADALNTALSLGISASDSAAVHRQFPCGSLRTLAYPSPELSIP